VARDFQGSIAIGLSIGAAMDHEELLQGPKHSLPASHLMSVYIFVCNSYTLKIHVYEGINGIG
jgi:hypothetical protein